MLSMRKLLTFVVMLQMSSSLRALQGYATRQLRVIRPSAPPLLPAYTIYAPEFAPEELSFPKPKFHNFYSAFLSPLRRPVYEFGYTIHDPKEENYQEKAEMRVGDSVKGYYSVREPNGYVRLVRYVSDENGFQTQVSHHHADDHGGAYLFTQARRVT